MGASGSSRGTECPRESVLSSKPRLVCRRIAPPPRKSTLIFPAARIYPGE